MQNHGDVEKLLERMLSLHNRTYFIHKLLQILHFFYCKTSFFIADSLLRGYFLCKTTEMLRNCWNGCCLYTSMIPDFNIFP